MTKLDPRSVLDQLQRFAKRVPPILRRTSLTERFATEIEQNTATPPESELLSLAIVGKMKIGKSTLINALIGQDLAHLGVTETTATVNWFSHGSSEQSQMFRVHWRDAVGVIEDRELSQLDQWRSNSELASRTRYLQFFSPSGLLRTMRVIDTPGMDTTNRKDDETTRGFLLGEQYHEAATLKYGGCADCLIYMLLPVAHSGDTGFLDEFRDHTRFPNSFPYNSVAVIHKWESINDEAPWQRVQKMAAMMADRLSLYVAAVIPVSGPLARATDRLAPDVWQRIAQFVIDTPAHTLQRLLAFPPEAFLRHDNCPISQAARSRLLEDSQLPWACFKLVLKLAVAHRTRDGHTLKAAVREVSGVDKLLDYVQVRFVERSRLIRCSSSLAQAFHPCRDAIDCLRDAISQVAKQREEARVGLREMQGLEHRAPTVHAVMTRIIEDLERRTETLDCILRELEEEITGVRQSLDQFHGDLQAVRTVESDPKCLNTDEVTEVLTILGIHGHSWRERLAAIGKTDGPLRAAERRLGYWRARLEESAGNRSNVLQKVVLRLEQIVDELPSELRSPKNMNEASARS